MAAPASNHSNEEQSDSPVLENPTGIVLDQPVSPSIPPRLSFRDEVEDSSQIDYQSHNIKKNSSEVKITEDK